MLQFTTKMYTPKPKNGAQLLPIDPSTLPRRSFDASENPPPTSPFNHHGAPLSPTSSSTATTRPITPTPAAFKPTLTLVIHAHGLAAVKLSGLGRDQVSIEITSSSGEVAYISNRPRKGEGNCVLVSPTRGQVARTECLFRPTGDIPAITLLSGEEYGAKDEDASTLAPSNTSVMTDDQRTITGDEGTVEREGQIKLETSSGVTRARKFTLLGQEGSFEWCYELNLVLTYIGEDKKSKGRIIAELSRSAQEHELGTGKGTVGAGGLLKIDRAAMEEVGCREELVVASCLAMLQKEVDQRSGIVDWVVGGLMRTVTG